MYDRLRKKRDELEILFAQRKFLNLVHEQMNTPAYMLRSYDLLMSSICQFPYGQELSAPAAVIMKAPAKNSLLSISLSGLQKLDITSREVHEE